MTNGKACQWVSSGATTLSTVATKYRCVWVDNVEKGNAEKEDLVSHDGGH